LNFGIHYHANSHTHFNEWEMNVYMTQSSACVTKVNGCVSARLHEHNYKQNNLVHYNK